jgi:hypothetical protein
MGATFVPDGGLIGAGAGTVNFPASLKLARGGLVPGLLNTVTGLLGTGTGAAFRDHGTLIDRLYDNNGLHLLGVVDSLAYWLLADTAEPGVLNLLGLGNPLSHVAANWLVYGQVAGWTSSNHVVWGDNLQSPSGQHVVWGDSEHTDSSHVVWGDSFPADGGR